MSIPSPCFWTITPRSTKRNSFVYITLDCIALYYMTVHEQIWQSSEYARMLCPKNMVCLILLQIRIHKEKYGTRFNLRQRFANDQRFPRIVTQPERAVFTSKAAIPHARSTRQNLAAVRRICRNPSAVYKKQDRSTQIYTIPHPKTLLHSVWILL